MHVRSMFECLFRWRGFPVALIALLACSGPLSAQEDDWYQVEVLVFDQSGGPHSDNRQLGLQLGYPDNWRQLTDPEAPSPEWLDEPSAKEPETPDTAPHEAMTVDSQVPAEQPYTLLSSSDRRLTGEARALERASGYRVLYHQAWRQPLGSRASSEWILVRGGETYGEHWELEGVLRIYLQRALFAQARLWHARFSSVPDTWTSVEDDVGEPLTLPAWPARFGGETPVFERLARESSQKSEGLPRQESSDNAWNLEDPAPKLYEVNRIAALEQTQRLELGTTLYLDHPELGVLIHVTRYQRDATGEESGETAEDDDTL